MMQRKKFRVDQMRNMVGPSIAPGSDTDAIQRHHELIWKSARCGPWSSARTRLAADHRHLSDPDRGIQKLKTEIDLIQGAINDTKRKSRRSM